MSLKRLALLASCLLLGLLWTVTVQAREYAVSTEGSGGQLHIGGGLPLPIQLVATTGGTMMSPTAVGTNFPPLLVPAREHQKVSGTTAMTTGQKLVIPQNVLSKPAAQLTLGQFGNNPNLYAVATNLRYRWPAAAATLSTGARTGAKTTTVATTRTTILKANKVRYSNVLPRKFGGPAAFAFAPGPAAGLMAAVPVTIYAIAVKGPGNPPCAHTALTTTMSPFGPFPGPGNPACVAGVGQAFPTAIASPTTPNAGVNFAVGGPFSNTMTTPGGTPGALLTSMTGTPPTMTRTGPKPGVGVVAALGNPPGQITVWAPTPAARRGFTNMASSTGFPWTTGKVTVSAPLAAGVGEAFIITGMDSRTAGGAGTIQLVAGGVSQRTSTGPNANRGWVRLVLNPVNEVPMMSPLAISATAGLMLLAVGYVSRRWSS